MLSNTRRKGKSIILFFVIFILANTIAGAIAIQEATKCVEKTIKSKLGSVATISMDYQYVQEQLTSSNKLNIEPLDEKLLKEIGKMKSVKYYDYSASFPIGSQEIKLYKTESDTSFIMNSPEEYDFQLKGVNYSNLLDIQEGKAKLVAGSTFAQKDIDNGNKKAIISKKLAEENSISVGDTLPLTN